MSLILPLALVPLAAAVLIGAGPSLLAGVQPGLWEVSRSASGQAARRVCLGQVVQLAEIEMRGEPCRRTALGEHNGNLMVELSCPRGDFARSAIRVTTPRSLRLETQGIHRGEPFAYRLYARRIGACGPNSARR